MKNKLFSASKTTLPYYRLFKFATPLDIICHVAAAVLAILCGIVQSFMFMIYGDVTGNIINYVSNNNETLNEKDRLSLADNLRNEILWYAIYYVLIGILTTTLTYVSVVSISYSSTRQISKMRATFLEKILYQDISWYDTHQTADFASVFTQNIAKIEEGIGEKVGLFLFFESVFLTSFILAMLRGWKMTLICMASMPISSGIMSVISWLSSKFSREELESYGKSGAIAEEVFTSIRTVVAFDGHEKETERYNKHLIEAKDNNLKKSFFSSLSNGIMWFFTYACCSLAFYVGVDFIVDDRLLSLNDRIYTPGNLIAVFFGSMVANWNFSLGTPYLEVFGAAKGAAQKIFDVLDSEPTINVNKDVGLKPSGFKSEIVFDGVSFNYPSRPDVKILQNFSLTIKYGQTVALVGGSGSGKSTCVQLLQRFYDPLSGNIFIDNNNIKDLNLGWLKQKMAVVNQEPALFATTIAENIKYGKLSATKTEIERAAKKANAHKFIMGLVNGYETVIGERGAQLSGGQKQRIAIARALIKQPEILLLDEATSALDTTSEAEVQAALDSISGQCTTIIVAHRLSTIRNANVIVFMKEGSIMEQGSHAELMAKQGHYYNLVTSQGLTDTSEESGNKKMLRSKSVSIKSQTEIDEEDETEESETKEEAKVDNVFFKIMKLNRPELCQNIVGCISSIFTGAALPLHGMTIGGIIGILSLEDSKELREKANTFCLYFLLLAIFSGLFTFLQMLCFGYAGEKLTLRIRKQTFKAMLHQEMGWFDRKENGVGSLCARLSGDASSIQGVAGAQIGSILNYLSTIAIACIASFIFEWRLALILLCFSPLILFACYFEQKSLNSDAKKTQKILEKSSKIAVEAIGNIRTVYSLNCENVFMDLYSKEQIPYIRSAKCKSHYRGVVLGFARSLIPFAYAAAMSYGTKIIIDENVPYGTVFQVTEVIIVGSWSVANALSFTPNFQKGRIAAAKIFGLLERTPAVKDVANPITNLPVKGNIEYSQVYFSYPTRPTVKVLNGLNLSIMEGKTIALVGGSGCGKSTIIQLLERFYDPLYGAVSLDDRDTKQVELRTLRSRLGIVSQEPNLFDKTIAENIAYGANHRTVPMDEIVEAAKAANIHSFITSLPSGYETSLGSKGTQLSGGQKQRIAIARALVRKPKILLLDEATSALDNESEKIVQEALDKARQGRTCITIAHRLTTIQDADVICVLKEGVVAEMGTHLELLDKKGMYFDFYKLQSGQH